MAQLKTWHTYWCLWWKLRNATIAIAMPKNVDFQVISSSSSWSRTTFFGIGTWFWAVHSDVSQYGLYYTLSWKLLIMGLLSEYFAALCKELHLKKIATKMFHISSPIVLFLMERSSTFLGIRIKFHLDKANGRGRGKHGEKRTKMRIISSKFPLLSEIWNLSHKLLVRQTATTTIAIGMSKIPCAWLSSDLSSFSGQINFVYVFLRNRYDLQIGYAMEKINSVLTRKKCWKWLDTPHISIFGHANSNGTGFVAVHSDVSEYGLYACIILETAHHRTTFEYFATLLKGLHLKNSCKMFYISSIVLFSYEKVKDILGG